MRGQSAFSAALRLFKDCREELDLALIKSRASFPRGWPLLHLDQVLVAPWLRAQDYRVLDPGIARHKMQWTRLTAR